MPASCLLLGLSVFLFFSSSQVQAKKHKSPTPAPLATPAAEPPPLPAEAAPTIRPDAPPSATLQPFLDAHLSAILAPLGVSAFAQPELIASIKASFADGLAAAPPSHKPAFQLAQSVCDALTSAMTERQNAVAALRGALATRSTEAEQPRGGGEAVAQARDKDAFFIESEKNTWIQHATVVRQNIINVYLRERDVERQIGVWFPTPAASVDASAKSVDRLAASTAAPVPAVSAAALASPTPPAAPPATVPDEPSQGWDPVIGPWLLEGRSRLTLGADHTITGDRTGYWSYTCTTGGGRNYELHWKPPKNWVDYLVLSGDGRTMDGKTRNNGHISYFRP